MSYWETKDALKELYVKAVQDPHVAWHLEYLKEKSKRFEAEEKYERLTRKIKENAVKEVAEREVTTPLHEHVKKVAERYFEEATEDLTNQILYGTKAVDFGAGPREVQHILKK